MIDIEGPINYISISIIEGVDIMVWSYRSPILLGGMGVGILLFQMISTCLHGAQKGGRRMGSVELVSPVYNTASVLINFIKSKMMSSKKLTCKGTLWQVFIRVYRLEIQSAMLVFSTQLCELLPL